MANALQLRRGTTTEHGSFTGLAGEITVDTTKDTLVIHDGSTAGGIPLAKESSASTNALTLGGQSLSQIQTAYEGYADTAAAAVVDSAPATLDTLNELAAALGDDANFSTTVTNSIATKMPLAGGTFTGDINMGSNDITTTGNILYSNVYSALGDLPSASTYHGMFAHVHATGKGYYAHGGNWIELVSLDTSGNLTVAGNLTVSGTTTTVNSTTLDVADLNITIADGAADAAAANGAGITVDGASATMLYTSATDTWDFNKAITGTYNNLQPTVDTSTASATHNIDYQKSMQIITMSAAGTFSLTNATTGAVCVAIIDTTTSPHTPTFHSSVKWPYAAEPTWASYRYWVVSFTCVDGVNHLASASPYTI